MLLRWIQGLDGISMPVHAQSDEIAWCRKGRPSCRVSTHAVWLASVTLDLSVVWVNLSLSIGTPDLETFSVVPCH